MSIKPIEFKIGAKFVKCRQSCCLLDVTNGQTVYCTNTGEEFEPPN